MPRFACALALLALLAVAGPSLAETPWAASADDDGDPRVEAELWFDRDAVAPGESLRVGVRFVMDPEWHIYWRHPGAFGLPTEVEWSAEALSFGPLRYPAPTSFEDPNGFGTSYGYAEEVLLFSEALVAEPDAPHVEVRASVSLLACHVVCIPGDMELSRRLPVTARAAASAPDPRFDRWAARLPRRADALGLVVETTAPRFADSGAHFESAVRVLPCAGPTCPQQVRFAADADAFAIDVPKPFLMEVAEHRPHPSGESGAEVLLRGEGPEPGRAPKRFGGILGLEIEGQPVAVAVEFPLGAARPGIAVAAVAPDWARSDAVIIPPASKRSPHFAWALLLAFLGGLILNGMPCVLPVLALKAFRIVESGNAEQVALRRQGLAYFAGVVASMAALAGLVVALRAAGHAVGWGFQFQEPRFVVAMCVLLTLFALNLFGMFEIALGTERVASLGSGAPSDLRRSAFDGLLAVLLATPCTAPFLGTAVGFAFAGSGAHIVAIFFAIGTGLAMPYLAMSWVPGLAQHLPRPGAWMEWLRGGLGFALLATVLWLLWIVGQSSGADATVAVLGLLLVAGLGATLFGRVQRSGRSATRRVLAALGIAVLVAGVSAAPIAYEPRRAANRPGDPAPWSGDAVGSALAQGQVVFVDFTADWCVTCKVNERIALDRPAVRAAEERLGIARFRADWTRRDEAIRRELMRHGRAGVPLYLIYRPGNPREPELLPEVLTESRVLDALQRAAGAPR